MAEKFEQQKKLETRNAPSYQEKFEGNFQEKSKRTKIESREKRQEISSQVKENINNPEYFLQEDGKVDFELVEKSAHLLPASTVLELEKRSEGKVLSRLFCSPQEFPPSSGTVRINFRNKDQLATIGLADFCRFNKEAKGILAIKRTRNGKQMEGFRVPPMGDFRTKDKAYLTVWSGDILEVSKKMTKPENDNFFADYEKKFKEAKEEIIARMPEEMKKQIEKKTIKEKKKPDERINDMINEALAHGVDPRFLLSLYSLHSREEGQDFQLAGKKGFWPQLRWMCTHLKGLELAYKQNSGRDARDKNKQYTLHFLAYFAMKIPVQVYITPQDYLKKIQPLYEGFCPNKLSGAADFRNLYKVDRRLDASKESYLLPIFIKKYPELAQEWDDLKFLLQQNEIPFEDFDRQHGPSLLYLKLHSLTHKYLRDAKTLFTIKDLCTKGWKFNVSYLTRIYDFNNSPLADLYRKKFEEKFLKSSLQEALEILDNTPQKEVTLDFPVRASSGSVYSYRPRFRVKGKYWAGGGVHAASDHGMPGGTRVRTPAICQVISVKDSLTPEQRERGSGCYVVIRTVNARGEMLDFLLYHMQEGGAYVNEGGGTRVLKAGEWLPEGVEFYSVGNTGVSTAPHIHLTASVNGRRGDTLPYLPLYMQQKVIAKRLNDEKYHSQMLAYCQRKGISLPRTRDVMENYQNIHGVDILSGNSTEPKFRDKFNYQKKYSEDTPYAPDPEFFS